MSESPFLEQPMVHNFYEPFPTVAHYELVMYGEAQS